jgi:nucleoside-diphosphate kinase
MPPMPDFERTLVLVKPDGVRRGLIGEVISRIERKGLRITEMDLRLVTREIAEQHYGEHVEKPFFAELVEFITSGPVVAMVVEGPDAVRAMRALMGATNPIEATPGSIRGDFATEIGQNIVHGSDSVDSGKREIGIFFPGA